MERCKVWTFEIETLEDNVSHGIRYFGVSIHAAILRHRTDIAEL